MRTILIAVVISVLGLSACGGGGGTTTTTGSGGNPPPPSGANVQAVTVDAGPSGLNGSADVNLLFTSVTICAPGTTTCQTIDHIQVDTGSSGLRILASALTGISLPLVMQGSSALAECLPFVDGSSWGTVRTADIKIAGETATSQAVQIIGDAAYPNVPAGCTGTPENTVAQFGANGILGIGPFIADCGSGCTTQSSSFYYACASSASTSCQPTAIAVGAQVSNPVVAFATDNNGSILQVPSIATGGATTVAGYLIFGIGTQGNNGLGAATVHTLSDADGSLTTQFNGVALTGSFIDSGSNAYYFNDSALTKCPANTAASSFFCPTGTTNLSALIQGLNGTSTQITFSVANAQTLFANASLTAFDDLAAPETSTNSSLTFDWGMPFFYGRSVFTAIEQHNTAGGMGPYVAF